MGPGGEPLADVGLVVVPDGPITDEAVGDALVPGPVRTLEDGSFRSRGGVTGAQLVLPDPRGAWPPWMLERRRVLPDEREVRLEARFTRVELEAVDRFGSPVDDGDSFCLADGTELYTWSTASLGLADPRGLRTRVLEAGAVEGHDGARPWYPQEPHTWVVEPGREVVCGWFSRSRGLATTRIGVGRGELHRKVTLVLGDPAPSSRLLVRVRPGASAQGAVIAGIVVEGDGLGAQLARTPTRRCEADGETFALDLPPGRYLVRAEPSEPPSCLATHGLLDHAPAVRVVDVGWGGQAEIDLTLERGARLDLAVRAPTRALDPRVRDLVQAGPQRRQTAANRGWLPPQLWACTWIRSSGDYRFRRLELRDSGERVEALPGLLPGTHGPSVLRLAPGRHVLRVECAGFELAEVELEAVDGEDLAVTVDLVPSRR